MEASADAGRFDGLFLSVADATGGLPGLFETFFSFLSRRTDFFDAPRDAKNLLLGNFDNTLAARQEKKQLEFRQEQERLEKVPRIEEVVEESEKVTVESYPLPPYSPTSPPVAIKSTPSTPAVEKRTNDVTTAMNGCKEMPPSEINGATTDRYTWGQTLSTVDVTIPLPRKMRAKELQVEMKTATLSVKLGNEIFLDGRWTEPIVADESTWALMDGDQLQLSLEKKNGMAWWKAVLEGDPTIDVQKVVPENSKLSDLDAETRQTVEKMLFDQRQKQLGLPTSDMLQQQEMLRKIQQQHPELDFSQAKFM